ncbi:hypothetical protein HYZ97_01000 [Candidatus Pacearchaeota archaeon]|nr:hypothetical protein [Candidatus Pacearchaeota archaeon]
MRGAIARVTGEGFRGIYHHRDSYPSSLGKTLWDTYQKVGDLETILDCLIDQHPGGWSSLEGAARCYCHRDWDKGDSEGWEVNQSNASRLGVEWVYAFDVPNNTMLVIRSFNPSGAKVIGAFGLGNPDALWSVVATIDLKGIEPDWKSIEEIEED